MQNIKHIESIDEFVNRLFVNKEVVEKIVTNHNIFEVQQPFIIIENEIDGKILLNTFN